MYQCQFITFTHNPIIFYFCIYREGIEERYGGKINLFIVFFLFFLEFSFFFAPQFNIPISKKKNPANQLLFFHHCLLSLSSIIILQRRKGFISINIHWIKQVKKFLYKRKKN